uniref:Uncharacterized protein n=1 Tax=Setaria digitata TaxID=48799 RepID=A0A915PZH2_9BILA
MGMTENQMHEESSTHIRRSNDKIKLAKKVHKKEMNSEAADKEQKGQRKRKITDNDYSKKNYSSYMDEADDMRKNYRKDQSNIENVDVICDLDTFTLN